MAAWADHGLRGDGFVLDEMTVGGAGSSEGGLLASAGFILARSPNGRGGGCGQRGSRCGLLGVEAAAATAPAATTAATARRPIGCGGEVFSGEFLVAGFGRNFILGQIGGVFDFALGVDGGLAGRNWGEGRLVLEVGSASSATPAAAAAAAATAGGFLVFKFAGAVGEF